MAKNGPEELRRIEKQAQETSARAAELMLSKPSSRWVLGPLRRLTKWVERKADEYLKEEGWR